MTKAITIKIPAPQFELHESVLLFWNGLEKRGRITDCRFELSSGVWSYQISGSSSYYPSDAIEPNMPNMKRLSA